VQTLKTEKNLLFSNFSKKYSSPEEAVDSYENALKEEVKKQEYFVDFCFANFNK